MTPKSDTEVDVDAKGFEGDREGAGLEKKCFDRGGRGGRLNGSPNGSKAAH